MDDWRKWVGLLTAILVAGMLRDVVAFLRYMLGCRLHEAAKLGRIEKVERFLEAGHDVDRLDPRLGFAPLHYAFRNGHVEVARLLVQHGADPGLRSSTGDTPLDLARRYVGPQGLRRALTVGDRPNATDALGRTSLHLLAEAGDDEGVALLLADGAHPDVQDERGLTPLFLAALAGQGGIAKLLIESGADVNRPSRDGAAPLAAAAGIGHLGLVRLLLAHGAEVDRRERDGWTALHHACLPAHLEVAEVLLEHGARTDLRDAGGRTASAVARGAGHAELAELVEERERGRVRAHAARTAAPEGPDAPGPAAAAGAPSAAGVSERGPATDETAFRPAAAASGPELEDADLATAWLSTIGGGIAGVFLIGPPLYGLGIFRREAIADFFRVAPKDAWRPLGIASAFLGFTLAGLVFAPRRGIQLILLALGAGVVAAFFALR